MSGPGGTSCSGPATSGRRCRPAVPVPGNPIRIACSLPLLDASFGRGRVIRHPTVEVISRIVSPNLARAPGPNRRSYLAGCHDGRRRRPGSLRPHVAQQVTHDTNEPEPSVTDHFIRMTL